MTRESLVSMVQPVDQSGQHSGDFLQLGFQGFVVVCGDQTSAPGQFQQWDAFLNRTAGDAEEVLAVGFCEATVAFRDVGGDRDRRTIQLICEEPVAACEIFGSQADLVCEIDGFLVDDQLLKCEGHQLGPLGAFQRGESSEETAADGRKFRVFYSQPSPICCSIFLTAGAVKKIGANATDLEIHTQAC